VEGVLDGKAPDLWHEGSRCGCPIRVRSNERTRLYT
jgi:hypothetical protein